MSLLTLSAIQKQLNFTGNIILTVLGNLGNALIIILFSRQRQSACSIYIISAAVVNFLFLILNGYFQLFPYGYSSGTLGATIYCKAFAYILNILGGIGKTMLIFACIDRYLITCDRATLRALSTVKRTKYLIVFAIVFWTLITLHVPLMRTIINGRCGAAGIYSTIFALLFVGLFPLLTLAIFGYLTYRNMRKMRTRVQPTGQNANPILQRRDRSLLIIIIAEMLTYIATTSLYPTVLLESTISNSLIPNKSAQYSQIESFMVDLSYLLLYSCSAVPFYTYFIASKSFRQDVQKLLMFIYHKLRGQIPVHNFHSSTGTEKQQNTRV